MLLPWDRWLKIDERTSVFSLPKLLCDVLAGTKRERENRKGSGFIRAIQKDAGITDIQIGHIVGLAEAIGDEFVGVASHAAGASLMQTVAGNLGFVSSIFQYSAGRPQHFRTNLLGMFPHLVDQFPQSSNRSVTWAPAP
jgi:hypothetical protein